jgi:hypothetical protein
VKAEVLAECERPGASVAAVAMAHGINANLVHKWRTHAMKQQTAAAQAGSAAFIPVPLHTTAMALVWNRGRVSGCNCGLVVWAWLPALWQCAAIIDSGVLESSQKRRQPFSQIWQYITLFLVQFPCYPRHPLLLFSTHKGHAIFLKAAI